MCKLHFNSCCHNTLLTFDALHAHTVVDLALPLVGENLVGGRYLLELLPMRGVLVRVVLLGQLAVGLN